MKYSVFITLSLALFLMMFSSCSVPFTDKDNGRTIELAIDDPFQIELKGNSSTGFQWEILPYDSTVIKQVGDVEYLADSDAIGSGGVFTYNFQTVSAGSTVLKIVYRKRFEEGVPPAKVYELEIISGTMGRIEAE